MTRPSHLSSIAFTQEAQYHLTQPKMSAADSKPKISYTTASGSKSKFDFETASISADSIMSEKEKAQAQKEKKPSLVKRAVQAVKKIEPPEPRIPEGRRTHFPAWA